MEDKNKEQLAVFSQIAEVIEKDSSMIIKNPVLGDVVFANGTLGNLEKKNTGGFGIKHIIDGRYRKDGLDEKEISALLYLIKDTVETVIPDDISKNRLNIRKNSIFVGVSKQWLGSDENWVITGFAENDENNEKIPTLCREYFPAPPSHILPEYLHFLYQNVFFYNFHNTLLL